MNVNSANNNAVVSTLVIPTVLSTHSSADYNQRCLKHLFSPSITIVYIVNKMYSKNPLRMIISLSIFPLHIDDKLFLLIKM